MANLTSQLLVRLIDGVSGPARKAAQALAGIGNAARGINGAQRSVRAAIERNNVALDAARGRMMDAVVAGYALKRALGAPTGAAMRFESAMADVAKVSNFDDAGIAKYGRQLRKLAVSEIPMAVEELAALSAAAAQSGVADAELFDFTRLTAKAAIAWEMNGAAAGEALAKIKTQLSLTTSQTALYADAINTLSDNSAASAADLVDYVKRVAAQGEFFGFSKEATLAFGSAMVGTGAQSEVAATSFRNMGRALTKGASATKRTRAAYKTLGLDAVKVSKSMQKNAVGTTLEVIERLGKLPEYMQASVMSDLFGDEARSLAPLLNNVDILKQSLALVADEQKYAGSVGKEFERRARTAEYALQRFKSQINEVGLVIGGALLPALKDIMAALGPIVLEFARFAEANPVLTRNVVAAAAALVGFRVAANAISWLGLVGKGGALSMLAGGFSAIRFGAVAVSTMFAGPLKAAVTGLAGYFGTLALRARLASAVTGAAPGMFARLADAMIVAGRGMLGILNPLRLVSYALAGLKYALLGTGIGAALVGIAAAGAFIYENWQGIKELFAGIADGFMKGLGPAAEIFRPVAELAERIFKAISGLVEPLQASNAEWRAWGETIGGAVADAVNAVANGIGRIVGLFNSAIEGARSLGRAIKNMTGFGSGPDTGEMPAYDANGVVVPGRASGGPISAGQTYMVGEEGPELITPSRSGYVHPNGTGPAGVTLTQTNNINIKGSSPGNFDELADRIARKIEQKTRDLLAGAQSDAGFNFAG